MPKKVTFFELAVCTTSYNIAGAALMPDKHYNKESIC